MLKLINGWTRAKMIERIRERVPVKGGYIDGRGCRYRVDPRDAASGTCVAGAFIPDDMYSPNMEGQGASNFRSVADKFPLALNDMRPLQRFHDCACVTEGANVQEACIDWVRNNVARSSQEGNEYQTQNGWTVADMIAQVRLMVPAKGCSENGRGVNRDAAGKGCAVGAFIPNALYQDDMRNWTQRPLLEKWAHLVPFMPLDSEGLASMQYVHDGGIGSCADMRDLLSDWIRNNVTESEGL